jgi:glycosyltransferase involved in cell wall biosynthesis
MTIAIISMIRDSWGGSEELWYEMAKIALKQGHKVIHVGYETPEKHQKIKELETLGLHRILRPGWIPVKSSSVTKKFYIGKNYLRKKLNSPIKKIFTQKPDIILYNGTCFSIAEEMELLSYIQKSKTKFYIIGHLHNEFVRGITDKQADKIRAGYELCKRVFFVSIRNKESAIIHLCKDISNTEIIRNPVNLASIDKIDFPDIQAPIQFASVGNLVTSHKGQDILLVALSKWQNKNWIVNFYGSGYDQLYLIDLVNHLKISKQVIFHGTVSDIREIWKKNHALLMSSHMEGMPLAVVEAMLCGRICIVTDVGGNSEWIKDGENGFLAEAATVQSYLSALERAWVFKENWPQIASMAHESAMLLYDPNAGATLLNRIIAE